MHKDLWIEDDCEDWARERAYLDEQDYFEYQIWLKEQQNKGITKVEIVEVKEEEHKQITL